MNRKNIIISVFTLLSLNTLDAQVNESSLVKIQDIKDTMAPEMGYRGKLVGNTLIACTPEGIIQKNIDDTLKATAYAFEGEDVIDFFQKGDTIIGLKNQKDKMLPEWVKTTDGGKTFSYLLPNDTSEATSIVSMNQHPTNKDILFIVDYDYIWRTTDFGKTWEKLEETGMHNPKGRLEIHPLDPNIICCHSENMIFNSVIYISRDGGNNWENNANIWEGDNCMHQMAFHPTDINKWICGGEGIISSSADCGKTWDTVLDDWDSSKELGAYFFNTIWDKENPNIIYCIGNCHRGSDLLRIVASGDGGKTWEKVFESTKSGLNINDAFDSEGKLVLYTNSGIYLLPKADIKPKSAGTPLTRKPRKEYIVIKPNGIGFKENEPIDEIRAFDTEGKLVYKQEKPTSDIHFTKGIYLLNFRVGGDKYVQKVDF